MVGFCIHAHIITILVLSELIEVGYDPVSYVTTETAGFVDLTIRVFSHPGGSPRPFSLSINTEDGTASMSAGELCPTFSFTTLRVDYVPIDDQPIKFNIGDVTQIHRILIIQDTECEQHLNKSFSSNISLGGGNPVINITSPQATVTIDESEEVECSEFEWTRDTEHF